MKTILALLLIFGIYLVGCESPEINRTRGGGPGADVGNRNRVVLMHEGSRPFENTPQIIASRGPSLDTANQADDLSRQ